MLNFIGLNNIEELDAIFKKLIDVKIDLTEEEIKEYSEEFFANKAKLKNHTEELELEDIICIYSNIF